MITDQSAWNQVRRINHRLRGTFEQVKLCRVDSRWFNDIGRAYLVDLDRNSIATRHLNLDAFEKELRK